ncbi:MAG: flagellar biosynthesis anti-sigma factor FlgM [Pseudomonadales bacterium]|nr:flagellar biosynthesis anti-sigma factor FlgM [Pseudomonadales bacterium]
MVNNINGSNSVQNSPSRSREKPDAAPNSADGASPTRVNSDKVELSPEAGRLRDIETGLKNFPEVNQERVSHIREALRDGSYSVDPARLAAKIVQFELDI